MLHIYRHFWHICSIFCVWHKLASAQVFTRPVFRSKRQVPDIVSVSTRTRNYSAPLFHEDASLMIDLPWEWWLRVFSCVPKNTSYKETRDGRAWRLCKQGYSLSVLLSGKWAWSSKSRSVSCTSRPSASTPLGGHCDELPRSVVRMLNKWVDCSDTVPEVRPLLCQTYGPWEQQRSNIAVIAFVSIVDSA